MSETFGCIIIAKYHFPSLIQPATLELSLETVELSRSRTSNINACRESQVELFSSKKEDHLSKRLVYA
ncbi:hypothetical protein MTR_4g037285 [Medicago truncatula]|uniref:Uncharacterized protein n=1 Tax=Medicago truncatula TaxID=3880 RepID=A0A072UJ80_MEDTR|nr:hypothetical protein MTR_4g037285 [Medicago truncatula]